MPFQGEKGITVRSPFHRLMPGDDVEERPANPPEAGEAVVGYQPDSAKGLIRAEELPSAAAALADLFPEEEPSEQDSSAAPLESEQKDTVISVETQPTAPESPLPKKRRSIFSWFFGSKDSEGANTQPPISGEAPQAANHSDEARPLTPEGASEDAKPATECTGPQAETGETPIVAAQLPPAAELLAEIFPPDQDTTKPATIAQPECDLDTAAEVRSEALVEEVPNVIASRDSTANVDRQLPELAKPEDPAQHESHEELPPQPQAAWPPAPDTVAPSASKEFRGDLEPRTGKEASASAEPESLPERTEHTEPRRAAYRDWALEEKLASHREWIDSHGAAGQRADLSGAELEAGDLISVNLRMADLHDANLRAADMLLADLRDACLVRADLEESCLVGANLEGANLEGASLETAMGLVPRQFAGANLRDALLAPHLMEFEAASKFTRDAQQAHRYFAAMTITSALSWLLVWKTKDAQLISDAAVLPFLHSRTAAAALPTAESYLIIPVMLLVLYLMFHFHLQRLWESVQELPAIFPDGQELGEGEPSIIIGLLRTHFRWMNPDPSSTHLVERAISILAAYGVIPATLVLFWVRYLTRQEIHGTILQTALVTVATGVSIHAVTKVGRPPERWDFERRLSQRILAKTKAVNPVSIAVALGLALLVISAGTIAGIPHDRARAPQYGTADVRRWAPTLFWWLGYDPYPDLTEASLSVRPEFGNLDDDQVPSVDGARLNDARLRYAQAYGVFLANAHMLHADLQGAFLSQADLRGADLGQSWLGFAVLDQAHMYRANLDRSKLDHADLRRADLRAANLSHSSLEDAILEDARLDGASLYTSRLDGATLTRADLEKADLRDAYLAGAHMDHADLQGTYLWSANLSGADLGGARLGGAILIDASLRGANLGGAQFAGTVLNNTDFRATSLEGADMRGALGLTASQVCSAKSRRGVILDDALEMQVEAQCGGTH